jgi:hypothetical protein
MPKTLKSSQDIINESEWSIEDYRELTWTMANKHANKSKGWRLPTLEELENAYNQNKDFFVHGTYWTSTNGVVFVCGSVETKYSDANKCFVRLIKSDNQTLETPLITLT